MTGDEQTSIFFSSRERARIDTVDFRYRERSTNKIYSFQIFTLFDYSFQIFTRFDLLDSIAPF